jgi:hypothetical protein
MEERMGDPMGMLQNTRWEAGPRGRPTCNLGGTLDPPKKNLNSYKIYFIYIIPLLDPAKF